MLNNFRKRPYREPLEDQVLMRLTRKTFAAETMKKVNWVVKMYNEWRMYRNGYGSIEYIECDLDEIESVTRENLCYAMTRFITEVRKIDGQQFPGKTVYDLVVCIQMYLETFGFTWKLIDDVEFRDLKYSLDNVMKSLTAAGVGVVVKQADVLSFSDEDFLWANGFLGVSNPQQLLNTVVFSVGMSCALRAGKEHRALRSMGFKSQISWHVSDYGEWYFIYREEIGLKTNKGGLKHRKVSPKVVSVYPIANRERCPVRILYKYFCKLPVNRTCSALYLRPYTKFSADKWFMNQAVGVNKLQSVVKQVCSDAGLNGYYTNHSLRSTAATRMYQSNTPEQVIQEITGHRSLAVRSYKRTSNYQRKVASNSIFTEPKCKPYNPDCYQNDNDDESGSPGTATFEGKRVCVR